MELEMETKCHIATGRSLVAKAATATTLTSVSRMEDSKAKVITGTPG